MPRILLVKTSSMGDVIHNLPVVADIHRQLSNATIDWVVEESFVDIPRLHSGVSRVIPFALRRWRKSLFSRQTQREIVTFKKSLQTEKYDAIIDTQGLLKSALATFLTRGNKYGYTWESAREPAASLFYKQKYFVRKDLHAVERNRQLAALALGYSLDHMPLDYGICAPGDKNIITPTKPYVVFLHGTSREEKLWSEANWAALGRLFNQLNLHCELVWGNNIERDRAERVAQAIENAHVQQKLSIKEAAALLANAKIIIGVDTGLTHLAAALKKKVVALYVSTDPGLTGVYGDEAAINVGGKNIAPSVDNVWQMASDLLAQ